MPDCQIKRALISVSDKTGLVAFCTTLANEFGVELISTGGTARTLREAGLAVTDVSAITGFPEMLDGRVKTLHPRIHAALLADRSNPEHLRQLKEQGIAPIDLVVVNLYPFEQTIAQPGCTFEDAIEQIDIGGPTLLRASAKNTVHGPVVLCALGASADAVLAALRQTGQVPATLRKTLAADVWATIENYDHLISAYYARHVAAPAGRPGPAPSALLAQAGRQFESAITAAAGTLAALRYGENAHQQAVLLPIPSTGGGLAQARVLAGEMSYNNYVDADAAVALVADLTRALGGAPAAAIIKHTNACGVATGPTPQAAYQRAYLGDPISAAGGVLCLNFPVTKAIAEMVMTSYQTWGKAAGAGFFKLDVWLAPRFDADAITLITTPTEKRKWGAQVRLVACGDLAAAPPAGTPLVRSLSGGLLVQGVDDLALNEDAWKVVTRCQPTAEQWADLRFAWLVCKHAKSNAIALARDGAMLGSGVGQTSRVMSSRLAILLARELGHADRLPGCVAASDAFFPVPDGPQHLIDAGVKAIIHPGGGNRDQETIDLCEKAGVAVVLTGTRHFKH